MKVEIQSYLAENNEGKSIFKIEMVNLDCVSWLNFNSVIEIDYNKHPVMKKSIEQLSAPDTTPEIELNIIKDILLHVTTIEGIEKCKIHENSNEYFNPVELKFNKFLTFLAIQVGVEEYTPFSSRQNPFYFRKFINKLTPHIMDLDEINRNTFEELITGHTELEEEYVQHYSAGAKFHIISAKDEYVKYHFYIMCTGTAVLFFFTRKSI